MIPKGAVIHRLNTTVLESSGVMAVVLLWKALVHGWTGIMEERVLRKVYGASEDECHG